MAVVVEDVWVVVVVTVVVELEVAGAEVVVVLVEIDPGITSYAFDPAMTIEKSEQIWPAFVAVSGVSCAVQ